MTKHSLVTTIVASLALNSTVFFNENTHLEYKEYKTATKNILDFKQKSFIFIRAFDKILFYHHQEYTEN
jgi:hypothetical protein